MKRILFVCCSLSIISCSGPSINRASNVTAPPKVEDSLLLKDFHPVPKLHTSEHLIPRAKYPVIDVHSHINDAAGIQEHQDPKRVMEILNNTNVKTVVILTGLWGEKLQKVIDEMVKPYPGRFIVFTQLDWSKVDEPDFAQKMILQIQDAVSRGAKGLKILKDFGLEVKDKNGKLIAIDDRRFDPIWEECGRLQIPVAIHTSDPEAFFSPIDGTNERYDELKENPSWGFSDARYPRKKDLLEARDRVFARHPKTIFFALHFANWPENLDYVESLLTRLPNVYIEFGARMAELGRQPKRAREFFFKFQDRIMFGSDNELKEDLYRVHFRWLETSDEYFDYFEAPSQGRWKVYGLGLPDIVLKKVYYQNAERLLKLKK